MTDRRVQILRFYFWAIVACAVALWNPWWAAGLAWLPLALFMPVFSTVPICVSCSGGVISEQYQVTVAGLANTVTECTNCTGLNGTWVVTFNTNSCENFIIEEDLLNCGFPTPADFNAGITLRHLNDGVNYYTQVILSVIGWVNHFVNMSFSFSNYPGDTSAPDCTAFSSLSLTVFADPVGADFCDGSGGSVTVTSL